MNDSPTGLGKLFVLVCVDFVLGVGLGFRMAADGTHVRPLGAVVLGGVVCITITAIVEKITVETRLQ